MNLLGGSPTKWITPKRFSLARAAGAVHHRDSGEAEGRVHGLRVSLRGENRARRLRLKIALSLLILAGTSDSSCRVPPAQNPTGSSEGTGPLTVVRSLAAASDLH